ncbi:MAG: OB-fold nucleic acid binding domain-containing protein, partial [Plesiomonas sp.]
MGISQLDSQPLTALSGVGSSIAARLNKLGLHSVQDLLFHLPLRYEDRTRITPIAQLLPRLHASAEGSVLRTEISAGRRRMLTCRISDGTGTLTLRFFHFTAAMKNGLSEGKRIKVFGEVKPGVNGPEIIHPEYRAIGQHDPAVTEETLTPVYPTTEGLKQASLRKLTDQALAMLDKLAIPELLPSQLNHRQISIQQALHLLHRPTPDIALSELEQGKHPAQQRLILEELLAHNLSMLHARTCAQAHPAYALPEILPLHQEVPLKPAFLQALPFSPTGAQQRVVSEIESDL